MAAIAHIALTAGVDKSLTWVTKPPLVLGEGGVTDITITWPEGLDAWEKYVEVEMATAVSVTIDGVETTSDELRFSYTDGMVLDAAVIAGKPKKIWAVAISDTAEVYKSMLLEMPPCEPGLTSTTDPAIIVTTSALAVHLADTSDAHDASAISVADSGSKFTGTNVEAVLAELEARIAALE